MRHVHRSLPGTTAALALLLAIAGSPAAAADEKVALAPSARIGVAAPGEHVFQDTDEGLCRSASPSLRNATGALIASCTTCANCGVGVAVCSLICGQAAATKNPVTVRECGLCLLGTLPAAQPCISACWNCMTHDRSVACQDYNSWSREMCTSEEWVCCNGVDGCTSCAPYGGYCPAGTYSCGYGSRPATCDTFDFVQVVREPEITVGELMRRRLAVIGTELGGAATRRPGWDPATTGFAAAAAAPLAVDPQWRQRGPDAVYALQCDDDDGGTGGVGDGDDDDGEGSGDTTCTDCSCQGEFTSWEGTVCGSSAEELVDDCWNSCY